ncbi:hypothetical protein SAMN02927900_01286 [Rhizobium mongolense subsp. loessense]|uniref:Uncharacterized protein n=1 Tax=Rhizobium mongolense subsp. loessense TaxID=158890 RepID=A0A1G4Q3B1_9HYPH|nr:hypothetical protein [Rhizobium mongolense]SCW38992.1 hypothetical protein SAMN02927900_01286 [Rhizobium mongolense subsp. loessense]
MGLLAILIAMVADPIRIVAVLLCVAFICKTYAPGRRLLVTAVSLAIIAAILQLLIESMHVVPSSAGELVVKTIIGYVATWIIAGIIFGCVKFFSARRQQHR